MTATSRGRTGRWARRIAIAFGAAMGLAGCGAQDLYEPPVAPFSVVARLPLESAPQGVGVLGDYAYIAAGQAGLQVVDISDPRNPRLALTLDTVKYAEAIRVASIPQGTGVVDIAFVVEGTEGVTTYDITDPENSYSFDQGTTAVDGNGLFVELPDDPTDPYVVYLAESWKGLRIFESDPTTPGLLRYNGVFSQTRGYAKGVTVHDGFAFVADDEMGLAVLDVRDRTLGVVGVVASCDTRGLAKSVDREGDYLFIADWENGLVVMELREEGTPPVPVPYVVAGLDLPGRCRSIVVRDGIAFIASQDAGVSFVDVSHPESPVSLGRVVTTFSTGLAVSNSGLLLVTDEVEGLIVLDWGRPFIDEIAPAPVTDLAARVINQSTVRLEWHAPGDDWLSGTAAVYDIRRSGSPIATDEDWNAATPLANVPPPAARGTAESFEVTGLAPGGTVHFALRTADETPNWSAISNGDSATTPTGNLPPLLLGGRVTPDGGTADTTFVFEVTYQDGDGDAPTVATVSIDGTPHDMTAIDTDYQNGALFRYTHQAGFTAVGAHEYSFTFADGVNPSTSIGNQSGPWVGVLAFAMGSPPDEAGRDTDETRHAVVLTRDYWISGHEVTQDEYEQLMGSNPSRFVGAALPVENVTWLDAVAYCNVRSADESLTPAYVVDGSSVSWNPDADGYRLPTEAEWEVAARGGTVTAFAGGELSEEACGIDPGLDDWGWYCGNAGATTHPVGQKLANSLGHYDMHGNVWEWCWDNYSADLGTGLAVDPTGPEGGAQRVIRGGSWYYFARECRSASRSPYWPTSRDDIVGFRVARTLP